MLGVFTKLISPLIAKFSLLYPQVTFEIIFAQQQIEILNNHENQFLNLDGFFVCNSPDVLLDMTLQGLGISLLPELLVRNHLKTRELFRLFPEWHTNAYPMLLLYAHKKQVPPHIRIFSDFLAENMQHQIFKY